MKCPTGERTRNHVKPLLIRHSHLLYQQVFLNAIPELETSSPNLLNGVW